MQDGTYDQDRQPVSYPRGFQVGLSTTTTDKDNVDEVIDYVIECLWIESDSDGSGLGTRPTFGVWTNTDNGDIYVEPCVWVEYLEEALALGRRHEQISVWCWATMKEIPCYTRTERC